MSTPTLTHDDGYGRRRVRLTVLRALAKGCGFAPRSAWAGGGAVAEIVPGTMLKGDDGRVLRAVLKVGEHQLTYQDHRGIGMLTVHAGKIAPLPFHVLCKGWGRALSQAPGVIAALAAGRVPEEGVFRQIGDLPTTGGGQALAKARTAQVLSQLLLDGRVRELRKGGEGARGGRVIGHTRSGKPIYAHGGNSLGLRIHRGWSGEDHQDAHAAHYALAVKHGGMARSPDMTPQEHAEVAEHHALVAEHHRKKAAKLMGEG